MLDIYTKIVSLHFPPGMTKWCAIISYIKYVFKRYSVFVSCQSRRWEFSASVCT